MAKSCSNQKAREKNLLDNFVKKASSFYLENFDEDIPPSKMYSEDEVINIQKKAFEDGITKGFEEGLTQGKEDAITAFEVSVQSVVISIEQKLENILKDQRIFLEELETNTTTLFYAFFKKLFPIYIKKFGIFEIEEFITNLLKQLLKKESLIIKINPQLIDVTKQHIIHEGFNEKDIKFQPDQNLNAHECQIEWENGGARYSLNRAYEHIDKYLDLDDHILTTMEEQK